MNTIQEFMRTLPQDADALMRVLSKNVDDEMLREIASADYGHDIERHLAPLTAFRDTGTFPETWEPWYPMEVLELMRWSQPDDPEWQPSGRGARGHWIRAFSAAAVMRYCGELRSLGAENTLANTLAPVVTSLICTNSKLGTELVSFCSWLATRLEDAHISGDMPTLAAVILLAGLKLGQPMSDEVGIFLAREAVQSAQEGSKRYWLYAEPWRVLAPAVSACDVSNRSVELSDSLTQLIAALDHDIDPVTKSWLNKQAAERDAWLEAERKRRLNPEG